MINRLSSGDIKPFVITCSSRALFDMEESHSIYTEQGLEAFEAYQRANENEPLKPGPALPLVRKLLALNEHLPVGAQPIEVILLSRNSVDSALRVFNTIEQMGLPIVRAIFTSGAPTSSYIRELGTQLFLSSNPSEVAKAIRAGIGAANISVRAGSRGNSNSSEQIRIAFDGDSVLFSDQAERVHHAGGLENFQKHEVARADEPLPDGPLRAFLEKIHELQQLFPGQECPVRTALVTARAAPAHKRPILTLRNWGVRIDEGMFLGGRNKAPFLKAFGADLFFDDSQSNIDLAADSDVPSGHVPYGVRNESGADESRFTGGAPSAAADRGVAQDPVVEAHPGSEPVVSGRVLRGGRPGR